jgi:hypothetical protein
MGGNLKRVCFGMIEMDGLVGVGKMKDDMYTI